MKRTKSSAREFSSLALLLFSSAIHLIFQARTKIVKVFRDKLFLSFWGKDF